jgi:hypothetical protein
MSDKAILVKALRRVLLILVIIFAVIVFTVGVAWFASALLAGGLTSTAH